jgi:membrane protease YdiL (CAAX protease family)
MAPDPPKVSMLYRYSVAALVVAALITVGFFSKPRAEIYQLGSAFIAWLAKRHFLRERMQTAWVQATAPVLTSRGRVEFIFFLSATGGVLAAVQALASRDFGGLAWSLVIVAGSWGLRYALARADSHTLRRTVVAGAAALLLSLFMHYHDLALATRYGLLQALGRAGMALMAYLPACFIVEEVAFRGILFNALRGRSKAAAISAALFTSTLWGLWHLPVLDTHGSWSAIRVVVFVGLHSAVGVALCWLWSSTGNLLPCALAHAVLDAVRDAFL